MIGPRNQPVKLAWIQGTMNLGLYVCDELRAEVPAQRSFSVTDINDILAHLR